MESPADPVRTRATGDAVALAEPRGFESFQRYMYWSVVLTSLGLLTVSTLAEPVSYPPRVLDVAVLLGLLALAGAVGRLTGHHIPPHSGAGELGAQQRRRWMLVGAGASLPIAWSWIAAGDQTLWPFAPALIVSLGLAAASGRGRRVGAVVALLVAAVVDLVLAVAHGVGVSFAMFGGTAATALVLFAMIGSIWTWEVAEQLDRSRRTAAALAVANERLRFAADLHDIQGHHLQVIALRSELASRLLRTDLAAAQRAIEDVHEVSVEALRDTRAVVHDYRRTALPVELGNAVRVLEAAGIDARLDRDPTSAVEGVSAESQHLLGLVVREAITNILRHSDPMRARVSLVRDGPVRLTISNDGACPTERSRPGGLDDLRSRLREVDGDLTWTREGGRFTVEAWLPPGPVSSEQQPDVTSTDEVGPPVDARRDTPSAR